jgi:hypothetical protein
MGLGQDVSRVDKIGIALVIAGDPSKHPFLAVAPIVFATSGTCSGGLSDRANRQTRFATPVGASWFESLIIPR